MPKIDFLSHIDLNNQQLLNATLQNLATAPSTTGLTQGFVYWNTADKTAYAWSGTEWIDLGSVYTHPTYTGTGQPASALTGANVISRITLTNGHVTGVTTRALTVSDIGASSAVHTHAFTDITGLPANTILGNNTGATGAAKALTVADLMTMLAIGYGSLALLNTGTDVATRIWSAKDISDFVNSKIANYITVVNLALGTRTSTTMPITNSAGTGVTLPVATTTLAGLLSAADKSKLDGIATNANNYVHPTDNAGTHPFSAELTSGLKVLSQIVVNNTGHVTSIKGRDLTAADIATVMINDAINNGTNTTWSSTKIYTEIQSVVAGASTGALIYKGGYNPATNTPALTTDATIKTGYTYVVSASGTFAGQEVEAGDMIIAREDSPLTTASKWQIVNKNIPAIVSATSAVEGIIQLATLAEATAGTNATKAITPATLKGVLNAKFASYSALFGDGSSTTFTMTHGLNTTDVVVQINRVSDGAIIFTETKITSANAVTIGMNIAPANNAFRVIVMPRYV